MLNFWGIWVIEEKGKEWWIVKWVAIMILRLIYTMIYIEVVRYNSSFRKMVELPYLRKLCTSLFLKYGLMMTMRYDFEAHNS